MKDIIKSWASPPRYYPTLVRYKDVNMTAMSMAAALYVRGANVNVSAINCVRSTASMKVLLDLPAYPWNHSKRYWQESRLSVNHRQKQFLRSDLLGLLVDDFVSGVQSSFTSIPLDFERILGKQGETPIDRSVGCLAKLWDKPCPGEPDSCFSVAVVL